MSANAQTVFEFPQSLDQWFPGRRDSEWILRIVYGGFVGVLLGLIVGMAGGLASGLVCGLIAMCIAWELKGRQQISIETDYVPRNYSRRPGQKALYFGLVGWLTVGLIVGLIGWRTVGPLFGLVGWLTVGLASWLFFGGTRTIWYLTLRIWFVCNGFTPWNYIRLLEFAADRLLLRKVGSGYAFIHRRLLEHFLRGTSCCRSNPNPQSLSRIS